MARITQMTAGEEQVYPYTKWELLKGSVSEIPFTDDAGNIHVLAVNTNGELVLDEYQVFTPMNPDDYYTKDEVDKLLSQHAKK